MTSGRQLPPWALGLAWLLGLALSLLATRAAACWILEQDAYFGRDLEWAEVGGEVTYLVMGDSHAATAVDTTGWSGAFNYAEIGESPVLTHEKARSLLGRGDTLVRYLLIAADPLPLANLELNANRKSYYYARFCDFAALRDRWGDVLGDQLDALRAGALLVFVGNGHQLAGLLLRRAVGIHRDRRHGAKGRALGATDMRRAADWQVRKQFRHRAGVRDELPQPVAIEALSATLDLAHAHGVRPVLVSYPVTREYLAALAERFPGTDWRAAVAELARSKDFEVPWLDLTTAFDEQPDLFYDPDHVTREGATLLTARLADAMLALGRR